MTDYYESDLGWNPADEQREFNALGRDIMAVQLSVQQRAHAPRVRRAFHAKAVYATTNAELRFLDRVPDGLRAGFAQPGRSYPVTVRLSNADGAIQPDYKKDLRGMALRVHVSDDETHDLLATNFPVSHARNAEQFVAFAKATAGGGARTALGLGGLCIKRGIGPREVIRMLRNVNAARTVVSSMALQTFYSRSAMRWGDAVVRFLIRPEPDAPPAPPPPKRDANYLSRELGRRLRSDDVRYQVCLQRYVDETTTPVLDTSVEWTEGAAPPIPVAILTIRRPSGGSDEAIAQLRTVDELAFNPWNTTAEFRPLGNTNRARQTVYDASAAQRHEYRWLTQQSLRNRVLGRACRAAFEQLNRVREWHELQEQLSLLNLDMLRDVLREKNLVDTERAQGPHARRRPLPPPPEYARQWRDFDGKYNDLSVPDMGAKEASFGRNLEPRYAPNLFDTPNPVLVAELLLERKTFIPAKSLNILAACWIQFQVHDWVDHGRKALGAPGDARDVAVAFPDGNHQWRNTADGPYEDNMRIAGNTYLVDRDPPIYFKNQATHWWDSSELYGETDPRTHPTYGTKLFDGPKFILPNGHLPVDVSGREVTGFRESWWLGLSALHLLFAHEHNTLVDELHAEYPSMSAERLFQTARMIVAALIAKIHTVEWTPAILGTKTLDVAMHTNWNGPPNDWLTKAALWLFDAHAMKGIPKTKPDHQGAPYSLTEDFVTVYRMHPLIPDDFTFLDHTTGLQRDARTFTDIQGAATDPTMREIGLCDVLYSFGLAYPGAITLHNFPTALRRFQRTGTGNPQQDQEIVDLAVVDLVRARRRGVPRYNDFRTGLHKSRITRWEDLTASPADVELLRNIYGDIDRVDTMVGLFAETPPTNFGFSDTAFRIFILMASRRLQSDRFLTVDFVPEVYTQRGMDWIAQYGMKDVIERHFPDLARAMPRDATAFAPWGPVVSEHPQIERVGGGDHVNVDRSAAGARVDKAARP